MNATTEERSGATIMTVPAPSPDRINRRSFLVAAASIGVLPSFASGFDDFEDKEVARVADHARKAGLGAIQVSRNEQYIAIGNAPKDFREKALQILIGLSRDYSEHFISHKLPVAKPTERMSLVILADRKSFGAYLGTEPDRLVGGVYDPDTNELAFFDNRADGGGPDAEKDNTLVLIHEATHQLTFNTGLLERGGDIPLAIAEGLACYAEVRSPNGKTKIGTVNLRRLAGLRPTGPRGQFTLTPVAQLIENDDRLGGDETKQVGYSEAWLLVSYLMKTQEMQPKFRSYLKSIKPRKDPGARLQDWKAAFGDPAILDKKLLTYLREVCRKNP